MKITTTHFYLVGVLGQNTWSRFSHTLVGLQIWETEIRKKCSCYHWKSNKAQLLTECVEDISDENKFARVELDHRGVRQELSTLEHTSRINSEDKF